MYSLEAHLLLSILLLTEPRKPLAEVYIWLDRATLHVKKVEGQRKGAESQIDGLLRVILNFDLLDIIFFFAKLAKVKSQDLGGGATRTQPT